ncbi:glycosyltransferase family 9 protein [Stygiobacter electus]|uniref:Glycosyltransferase family 9 protein n=1 Tax=Stygiobacter electus TaxID=3032292 RepID=A0AAE3NWB0_9BACT|nr:glycosyltransferase family 9 protein [Stygiobacter electus]MDF1612101.1 glycosyltransferase family 9 protein [Stygiobacter electus]
MRILIVRQDRIGDVVLSTPLPREIKKVYPNSFVAVMVRNYTKDIYLHNPYVDEIIIYDETKKGLKNFLEDVKKIKKYKFTHALMLLPNEKINYLLFFAGIPFRIGVGHKLYQFITFTKFVDRKKYNPLRHEADYSLDLIRKIGIEPTSTDPEIFLSDNEKIKAKEIKRTLVNNDQKLIGINTSSGNSAPNLPLEEYKRLILKLSNEKRIKVVITDINPDDSIKNLPNVIYPMTSLRNDILIFSILDLLISSSTGPMHICSALKVKTLSLFCPLTACSPKLWGPLGNESRILLPKEDYCRTKCPVDPKKCNYKGDSGINAETVYEQAISFLN